ncbi:DciA family protein [Acidisoma sp.]|uniref:DciA family protein n=1 Tax=Acidisoma sp. TaxID=1872115 RepID=UPI003B00E480
MPPGPSRDNPPDAPRAYGPRAIGGLITRVTKPGFKRRSPATSQIMTDWIEIMGPDLGGRTVPQKLSAGTLTIACAGPAAMELQHFAPQLIARINGHVGGHGDKAPIQRLRFVQQNTLPKAAVAPERPRAAPKPPPAIDLEPGPVRDALIRLAQALQTRRE